MKRWLILLAALLVLAGCAAEPEDTTPPTPAATEAAETLAPTELPTEPVSLYEPDSTMEIATGGTIRAYPLGSSDTLCVLPMGNNLLVLSGTEATTMTILTGDDLCITRTADLRCAVDPHSPALRVSEKNILYYDESNLTLVTLDADLTEMRRLELPDEIVGSPALSADGRTLYYCTADSLRAVDLESRIDKLLKEMPYACRSLTGLYCDDTILACSAADEDGQHLTVYLSTQTGETIAEFANEILLWTEADRYVAVYYDGAYPELLTGTGEGEPQLLSCSGVFDTVYPLAQLSGVILSGSDPKTNTARLDCCDPSAGTLTASVTIPGTEAVRCICSSADGRYIWFLRYDSTYKCDILCRWDMSQNLLAEPVSCLGQRFDAENPDLEGLARCAETAAALSETYGVEILTWDRINEARPPESILTAEHQVPLIEAGLNQLEAALSRYPEGFLEKAAAGTDSGKLKICLVRSIETGDSSLQYWTEDSACIALCPDRNLEQNFHHQLFYILENRVLGTSTAFDSWNKLNPKEFSYTLDTEAALSLTDSPWLEGSDRAFITADAMSFPRVDRARVMEYAMMRGNESCFESEIMQQKLRKLCVGIRDAFELEDSEAVFLWEQYLSTPLTD